MGCYICRVTAQITFKCINIQSEVELRLRLDQAIQMDFCPCPGIQAWQRNQFIDELCQTPILLASSCRTFLQLTHYVTDQTVNKTTGSISGTTAGIAPPDEFENVQVSLLYLPSGLFLFVCFGRAAVPLLRQTET